MEDLEIEDEPVERRSDTFFMIQTSVWLVAVVGPSILPNYFYVAARVAFSPGHGRGLKRLAIVSTAVPSG